MNKCVECDDQVTWNPRSSLCGECYEKELKIKLADDYENIKAESPHASWF